VALKNGGFDINNNIRVSKDVSQELDTASASIKKKQRLGVMFFIMTKDKPRQKLKVQ